jgi:pimeloyl-ACP methyl ester carboxylesterase
VRAIGGDNDSQSLAALIEPHLESADVQGLASIPLVELPSDHPSRLLAVVMSGDGGWRDIDKTLAERLQHDGVSVVGWDSLRYFWRKKTPERTAEDLAAVIQSYRAKWGADKVALVGYSFGADVLPAAYALLPALIKRQVAQVSMARRRAKQCRDAGRARVASHASATDPVLLRRRRARNRLPLTEGNRGRGYQNGGQPPFWRRLRGHRPSHSGRLRTSLEQRGVKSRQNDGLL